MASSQTLAERILPARGAAKKASASFIGQLDDSPGRSDAESSPSSNPFRDATHKAKAVKYRYSAMGKHLSSPLKGSPSSPERKKGKSKPATFTPAPSSRAAKPNLLAAAPTSRKRKASASSLRMEALPGLMFLSTPSPLSSAPTTPTLSTKDLPLSSAPPTKDPIPNPPKRLPISKSISLRSLEPTASKFSVLSQPLSPKRKQKKGNTDVKKGLDVWDIEKFVWILVNHSGVLAENQSDLELSEPLMWWPAQVVQKRPLHVLLFGDFPSSSSTSRGLRTIFAPSSSSIQSIHDDSGAKRFTRMTFHLPLSPDDHASPPAKKPRLDEDASIEAKWESAVQSMEKASTLEQDGLPALLSSFATTGDSFYDSLDDSESDTSNLRPKLTSSITKKSKLTDSTRKLKSQRSRANMKDDVGESTPRSYSPCPPDPTLQIPGELVLAMAPKTGGSYWPAKILDHVPGVKEKYKVKFLDDEEHVVTRDRFWTLEEEGFVQCTLGEWESAVKTVDDPESGDEGEVQGADDDANVDDPNLPPPPPARDFEELPVGVQVAYVKPVLRAILNKEYAPAREKHDAFMKGGAGRVALLKSAGIRGGMDVRFIKAVQKAICKWVLRANGVRPERLDTAGASGTEGAGGVEGGATVNVVSPEVVSTATLSCDSIEDNKMEGIEGAVDVHADKNDGMCNAALPLPAPDKRTEVTEDCEMTVDGQEQKPESLPPANSVALSPAMKQASLAPKSQLDLLAEVSQAVATEPSLLPSHPEVPRLKVDLLDITCKDASPQQSPLTPVPDEDQQIHSRKSGLVVCEEFEALSGIEKLDYCLNILLPESIQQLLLWRSGERTSSALLSSEEEQRLRDVGIRKAAETDWVDDVMRLRAAQARLWGIDPNKKAEEKKSEVVQGGKRTRPRRGTVSRP